MNPFSQLLLPIAKYSGVIAGGVGLVAFLLGARGKTLAFSILGAAILGGVIGYMNSSYSNTAGSLAATLSTIHRGRS